LRAKGGTRKEKRYEGVPKSGLGVGGDLGCCYSDFWAPLEVRKGGCFKEKQERLCGLQGNIKVAAEAMVQEEVERGRRTKESIDRMGEENGMIMLKKPGVR